MGGEIEEFWVINVRMVNFAESDVINVENNRVYLKIVIYRSCILKR